MTASVSSTSTTSETCRGQTSPFEHECWKNLLRGCQKSKDSSSRYATAVKHYMKFLGIASPEKILEGDVAIWEKNILSYLDMQMERGLSSHIMSHRVNAIRKFYMKNKIKNIDWSDIRESIPETRDRRDRPYVHSMNAATFQRYCMLLSQPISCFFPVTTGSQL